MRWKFPLYSPAEERRMKSRWPVAQNFLKIPVSGNKVRCYPLCQYTSCDRFIFKNYKKKQISDPLRAVSIFMRKVMGHTAVSAIQASSVTL